MIRFLLWLNSKGGSQMISFLMKAWEFLKGKKSYVAAAGLACYGVYDVIEGNYDQGWHKIMEAAAVFGLRNAIK